MKSNGDTIYLKGFTSGVKFDNEQNDLFQNRLIQNRRLIQDVFFSISKSID